MWVSDKWTDYELLDTSSGERLERWGDRIMVRPDPQVIWDTPKRDRRWNTADAKYSRSSTGGGSWEKKALPESWQIKYGDLVFNIKPMNFKHTGIFPEQAANWDWAMEKIKSAGRPIKVLNLFAYTGASTAAMLSAGAEVCHVDAAKGMVAWAKENAVSSGVADKPVRWIIDDCAKFVQREIRRVRSAAVFVCAEYHGAGARHADKPGAAVPKRLRERFDSRCENTHSRQSVPQVRAVHRSTSDKWGH